MHGHLEYVCLYVVSPFQCTIYSFIHTHKNRGRVQRGKMSLIQGQKEGQWFNFHSRKTEHKRQRELNSWDFNSTRQTGKQTKQTWFKYKKVEIQKFTSHIKGMNRNTTISNHYCSLIKVSSHRDLISPRSDLIEQKRRINMSQKNCWTKSCKSLGISWLIQFGQSPVWMTSISFFEKLSLFPEWRTAFNMQN